MLCPQLQRIQMIFPWSRSMLTMLSHLSKKMCCHLILILSKLIQKQRIFTTLSSQSTPIRIMTLVLAISPSLARLRMTMRRSIRLMISRTWRTMDRKRIATQSQYIMKIILRTSLRIMTTNKHLRSSIQSTNQALSCHYKAIALSNTQALIIFAMTLSCQYQDSQHWNSSSKSAPISLTNQ